MSITDACDLLWTIATCVVLVDIGQSYIKDHLHNLLGREIPRCKTLGLNGPHRGNVHHDVENQTQNLNQ